MNINDCQIGSACMGKLKTKILGQHMALDNFSSVFSLNGMFRPCFERKSRIFWV